jgi:hypothetical protein
MVSQGIHFNTTHFKFESPIYCGFIKNDIPANDGINEELLEFYVINVPHGIEFMFLKPLPLT